MVEIFLSVCRVIAIEKHAGSTYYFFFINSIHVASLFTLIIYSGHFVSILAIEYGIPLKRMGIGDHNGVWTSCITDLEVIYDWVF